MNYLTNMENIIDDIKLLEIGRKAIEDVLIEWRDNRISMMRNNGLVIKERNGKDSHIIRMGPEDAIRIGMRAIINHLKKKRNK